MTFRFDPAEYADMPSHIIRRDISSQVERMIDYLDSLETDPDLEPDFDNEESLGWCISHGACTARSYVSLPAALCDLEGDEHDGKEPDVCGEIGLGWTSAMDQDGPNWNPHDGWGQTDREYDPAESGIADEGGLQEQWGATLPFDGSVVVRHMEGVL